MSGARALSQARSDAIRAYNEEAKKPASNAERLQILAQRVKLAADRFEELPAASPVGALSAMDRAHHALVTFAKTKSTPQSLADLADAIHAFAIQAQEFGEAVRPL
jgi:hypothetical protein